MFLRFRGQSAKKTCLRFAIFNFSEKLQNIFEIGTRRIFAFTRALCWGETLVLLRVVSQGFFCNDAYGLSCNCFCIGMLKMQGYYLCIQVENIVVM